MNLNWYSFEESYLLSIKFNIMECKMEINIDGRMSIEHPKVQTVSSFEERFEAITLLLYGVQYYRGINSKNLNNESNDDKGSIYGIALKDDILKGKELDYKREPNISKLSIDLSDGTTAEIYSKSSELKFLDFISEMVAFRVGFEKFEIINVRP